MPLNKYDPKGHDAAHRQVALWRQQERVTVITRSLNYRDPRTPKEKGIDVALAIDFAMMAARRDYDVGILFSVDTDLVPALEAVASLPDDEQPTIEVAAWRGHSESGARQLRLGPSLGDGPYCHFLSEHDYQHVRDDTNYSQRRRRR